MDDFSIAGPPCPFCGASMFTWDAPPAPPEESWLAADDAEAEYRSRVCADCGQMQVLLTAMVGA